METSEDILLKNIELLLESDSLLDDDKALVNKLLSTYLKQSKRFNRILKQSDKMSAEIALKNDKLQKISGQLSKYLSPQIYDMIFSGNQDVLIGSARKKLTIFFSDIVNFTATTEKLESEELTGLLNNYLTEMSEIALKHGATIDKYIGDAIVIFFGDPETSGYKEDALKCVKMAIEMKEKTKEIRNKYVDDGIVDSFDVRMGINTGYCTVGNFGSNDRMDYTIIGGNVNLAARLESNAHQNEILISHETQALIKGNILTLKQNAIMVKGISHPVQTYQVQGLKDSSQAIYKDELQGLNIEINRDKINNKKEVVKALHKAIENIIMDDL